MYSLPNLEPVHCSMSDSNCCFLTSIQVSQEAGQVVWYSHLLKNFPQFLVTHTVKGFGVVNKAEVGFFWNSIAFLMIQSMLAIWSLVLLPFLNSAWTSGSSRFTYFWSLAWRILSITLLVCAVLSHFSHVWLFATLWTIACQTFLSMGFSRQEYWSGLPFPSPASVWDEYNCAVVEHSLALPYFGITMKIDLFQFCGHCWVLQICWHIECST